MSEHCGCIPKTYTLRGGDKFPLPEVDRRACRWATLPTVLRILIENQPGASLNAVREDYPELAKIVSDVLYPLGEDEQ